MTTFGLETNRAVRLAAGFVILTVGIFTFAPALGATAGIMLAGSAMVAAGVLLVAIALYFGVRWFRGGLR